MTRRQPFLNRITRSLTVLVMAAGLLLAGLGESAPAQAIDQSKGTPGYCPDATGVTVIIDFQELGGDVIIRCAPGDQATGLTALKNAGIEITGTNRWGEAFICRIEGKPGADTEPCIDTPPATAYWSYWHASNGGEWTYSQWGVMNRKPPPGSFEGWSFSKDKTETTNPPPRYAPVRPAQDDSGEPSGSPDSPGGDSGTTGGDNGSNGSNPPGDSDAPGSSDEPSEATTDDATDADGAIPGTDDLPTEAVGWTGHGEDGMQPASAESSGGIPMSTVAGLSAIGLLAAGAAVAAWRRRAPEATDEAV
ncbi:hypothetical protein FB566_0421 [Stackebrandtia endophytica]|uniref:LPXTG-motif cell wall-anchored protein n=1 Tax=Stackebrandtia endophytica TaxID=1496996 RepID=A0A543AQR3_9ACTN|nr:hypothetical protein [Stackebrandtia endophytica]TQL74931.1 hypothetical protein FB566_0421 [Stackebrandtia endophytica]